MAIIFFTKRNYYVRSFFFVTHDIRNTRRLTVIVVVAFHFHHPTISYCRYPIITDSGSWFSE